MLRNVLAFVALLALFSATAQVNLSSSLTACYALNGNAYEPISNLTGTLQNIGASTNRFNTANSACNFSCNAGAFIALPNSGLLKTQELSFSIWLRPITSFYARSFILYSAFNGTANPAIALTRETIGNTTVLRLQKQGSASVSTLQTTNSLVNNNWSHVVCTISNTQMAIYMNGLFQASVTTQGGIQYSVNANVYLGGTNEPNHNEPYCGDMDNTRFYARAISAQEVSALYTTDPACVTATAAPVANFTATPPLCVNQPIQFNDMSANAPSSWQWSSTGGITTNAFLPNPVFTFTSAGVVQVSLKVANSFGTNSIVSAFTIAAQPTITVAQTPTLACRQMPATITASGANSYTWSPVAYAGASYSFYVGSQLSYTVSGTTTEGCIASKTLQVKSVVCDFFPGLGMNDIIDDATLNIIKSAKGTVEISCDRPMFQHLRIYSMDMRLIEEVKLSGERSYSFKPDDACFGIYLFEFSGNGKRVVKKLAF